jgi:hypothetical protein
VSIAVAPPAVMITMIVMQRHIPAFSIGRPVPGPRLRHIRRPTTTASGRAGRHQCGRGNEGGCGQAADHRFGRHGSSPCDPTIMLKKLPQTDASSCDRQHALDGLPRAAAPTVWRVQGGTGRPVQRPSCSPATKPGASPPTSPSCRSCCGAKVGSDEDDRAISTGALLVMRRATP